MIRDISAIDSFSVFSVSSVVKKRDSSPSAQNDILLVFSVVDFFIRVHPWLIFSVVNFLLFEIATPSARKDNYAVFILCLSTHRFSMVRDMPVVTIL